MHPSEEKSINRRYRISYILMPLPMVAAAMIAAYIYINKDVDTDSYCVVASSAAHYQRLPENDTLFEQHQKMKLPECQALDEQLDHSDGRTAGKVRWFVCTGMSCGPQWQQILAQ